MRRSTTKNLLTAGLLTLGSVAFIPSCAKNDSSMFLIGVIDIDQSTCLAKADTTDAMLASGALDTALKSDYTAFLLVGNQLTQQGSREDLRTETSKVTIRGAEITLTSVAGEDLKLTSNGKSVSNHFSTVGTGFVDAAAGDAPSYGAVSVNIIPAGLSGLPGKVLAKIRVFGSTLGGADITSSELDFPITVCEGCLVTYPAVGDPVATTYMCPTPSATDTTVTVGPCVLGQDAYVSCTQCLATVPLCKDPSKNPTFSTATP